MTVCLYSCLIYPVYKTHATYKYYIAICGLICCTIFFHIISYTAKFSEKYLQNVCFDFLNLLVWNTSSAFSDTLFLMYRGLHENLVTLWVFISIEFSNLMFIKHQISKVMNVQPVGVYLFLEVGPNLRNQYWFLPILLSHLKVTYTRLHTQHAYKKTPWDRSCKSQVIILSC